MIDALLERIYAEGQTNDASATDRVDMAFNITPSTGRFLDVLIGDAAPRHILEIGTSTGYSTIWLGRAAKRIGATVDTIDCSAKKHATARRHLLEAGFAEVVSLHTIDAGEFLATCKPSSYDLIFLDSDRKQYAQWSTRLFEIIQFGTLVVDNAVSHANELAPFFQIIAARTDLDSVILPIGKGQLVVRRSNQS